MNRLDLNGSEPGSPDPFRKSSNFKTSLFGQKISGMVKKIINPNDPV
jgi:hypothetical protein